MIANLYRRLVLGAAVMVGALATVGVAHANGGVSWSLGINTPGVALGVAAPTYYNPPPVYYNPPPVYSNPAPVYVPPRPVYYSPPPVYVAPQPIYYGPPRGYYGPPRGYYGPPRGGYGPPPQWRGGGYGDWRR